jgi:hypothetical protein
MMKKPEMIEGPEAFQRFRDAMKAVLAVPHSVIKSGSTNTAPRPRRIRTGADRS